MTAFREHGFTFDEVRRSELEALRKLSGEYRLDSGAFSEDHLLGLAFSGGGIRSATFNLGVLQALSQANLLKEFDYLSTVSGGGYVGSWLSAWIHRAGEENKKQFATDVQRAVVGTQQPGVLTVQAKLGRSDDEPKELTFLRSYSNYLTPKLGLFSGDTLAGIATYIRNLLLNLSILILYLAAGLLGIRAVAWLGQHVRDYSKTTAMVALVALVVAIAFINLNIAYQLCPDDSPGRRFTKTGWVMTLIVFPLAIAAAALGFWLAAQPQGWIAASWLSILLGGAAFCALCWFVALWVVKPPRTGSNWRRNVWRLGGLAIGILAGIGLLHVVHGWLPTLGTRGAVWNVTVWGLPALLGVFGLSVVLVIGVTSRDLEEESREWWSRLGGALVWVAVAWTAIAASALYGPYLVIAGAAVTQTLSLAWVVSTLAGVLTAKSSMTGKPGTNPWKDLIPKIAPHVFVAGLLIALSYGIHAALVLWWKTDHVSAATMPLANWDSYWALIDSGLTPMHVFAPLIVALLVGSFLAKRVDINLFSFHMFYRNRLMRCYLGASNTHRNPHPYTGFDPKDSVPLKDIKQRPYHLINTAINITRGKRLAWQERKAASFVLSPLFCGYDLMDRESDTAGCYQLTEEYVKATGKGHLTLGEALTISGAAASPNMGYHSSPAVAFLLTVFNVRLGWWMQNTRYGEVWRKPGPHWGFNYLFSELAGATDESRDFVYLSDGGHFDNLGIYELVRRRCRYIVACDAGCDPGFGFEDLGNAIRKCKIDLGVTIEIDTRALVPDPQSRSSVQHCVVGTIKYENDNGRATEGYLLYIKPSLTGSEPLDVGQYAKVHAAFPHEPTSDQWFGESQFESYRQLGQHIARTVFEGAGVGMPRERSTFMQVLYEHWYPVSSAVKAAFSRHAEELKRLHRELRTTDKLHFLDAQMYPEWDRLMAGKTLGYRTNLSLPANAEEVRAGFYFCNNLLQLMEAVYVDLNLEQEYDHPDNRGWMNLFKHWSWSSMFVVTFGICCATYGGRFQRFCQRRLQLSKGEVDFDETPIPADLGMFLDKEQEDGRLNFVEAAKIREWKAALEKQSRSFDTVLRLKLSIPDPSLDSAGKQKSAALEFTCGFALASEDKLVYFRVQDHLRRMGLAREALKAVCAKGKYLNIAEHAQTDTPEDMERFRSLLKSVLREINKTPPDRSPARTY